MDSITHALYRAIAADNNHQRSVEFGNHPTRTPEEMISGLQPLSKRRPIHDCYADAAGTDLHISLTRGDELLALQLEFIAGGFCPPASMYLEGADVVIAPGEVELFVGCDNGSSTWTATLRLHNPSAHYRHDQRGPKAGWTEQVA